ncbi:HupE/UreJ family protein [Paenibacillus sp. BC26]|uniref:HupE/UreJ family protein n=1 Tax=Paenibacillus sp. BC26 TaxID=1881032 RepID=UPI0008EA0273|nr:HupE/UreJ family protein [Paenibacillus sp. BC26]SFS61875.1 HupE / UreJ protein [Paenibacillus sp. BC26]
MRIRVQAGVVLASLWMFFTLFGGTAQAHFSSTGFSDITIKDHKLEYNLFLLERELLEALPTIDQNGDGQISANELTDGKDTLTALANDRLIVTGNSKVGNGAITAVKQTEKAKMPMVEIDITYDFAEPVERYMVQYNFYDGSNPDHRSFATIRMGQQSIVQVINSSNNILEMEGYHGADNGKEGQSSDDRDDQSSLITTSSSWTSQLSEYTKMGMEHIWSGADHLLFLVGLILAAGTSGWTMLKLISAFTVGHSITLVLSALDLASLSPLIVEPLIALSIVFVAFENLYRKNSNDNKRMAVTVMFGMVHGFGFAEILHGTLAGHVALPLFSFNLGVEIGQLAVLAIVVPLLLLCRRFKLTQSPIWKYGASSIVGIMGMYWLIERLVTI